MLILNLIRFSVIALITVEVFAKRVNPWKFNRISKLSEEESPNTEEEDPRYGRPGHPGSYPERPHHERPHPERPYPERPYPERPYPEHSYPEHPFYPGHPYPEQEPYPEHEPHFPPWVPVTFPPTYRTTTRYTFTPPFTRTTPRNNTTPIPTGPPGQCCCQCQCDCLDGVLIRKISIGSNQSTPDFPPQCPICFPPHNYGKRSIEDENELTLDADPQIRSKRQTLFIDCFSAIRAAQFLDTGTLLGLLVGTLLANLVVPILLTVLAGDNSLENAVLPLANILCYIVGLLLLVLRSLGLLGVLGMGGLLQNILGGAG